MSGVESSLLLSGTDPIQEYLITNPIQGKPGIKGKLVDPEGFPRYAHTHAYTLLLVLSLAFALAFAVADVSAVSRSFART